jgi:hypothetical protein
MLIICSRKAAASPLHPFYISTRELCMERRNMSQKRQIRASFIVSAHVRSNNQSINRKKRVRPTQPATLGSARGDLPISITPSKSSNDTNREERGAS